MHVETVAFALDRDRCKPVASARALTFAAVGLGTFMTSVDGSSVTTILPVIGRSFGGPVATLEWVVTANLLVMSTILLVAGWVADACGHTRVYVTGVLVFVTGSTICAAAPSVGFLIAVRAMQAIGSAMILATSAPLLMRVFAPSERGWALGLHVALNYVGLTLGPWLGGGLADSLGWRAMFLVYLPLGGAAVAMSMLSLCSPRIADARPQHRPFDALGAGLFGGALASLLFALNQVRHQSLSVGGLGAFLASLAALTLFVIVESRTSQPILDWRAFARVPFIAAVSALLLGYVCLQSVTFMLPFYLIRTRGLAAAAAGLMLAIRPAVTAAVAPVSGRLSDRTGPMLPGAVGMAVLCAGCVLVARLDAQASLGSIACGLIVIAVGMGTLLAPVHSALFGAVRMPSQGVAASIMNVARTIGMAVGVEMGRIMLLGAY